MSIAFPCPGCGKKFAVGDEFAGKKGKCNQCGGVFVIPARTATKAAPPPPVDLYDVEEESAPLPPRSATARPATMTDAAKPWGGSGKKNQSTSDGSKKKGFFAGIGGTAVVVIFVALRLFNMSNRIAKQQNGPSPVMQAPSAFGGAPFQVSTQTWTMPVLPERGAMRELEPGVTF